MTVRLDRIAAILLDMDGTLVDSDAAVERAWTAWAREHRVDPAAALAVSRGHVPRDTARQLLPHLDEAAVARAGARQLALQYDDVSDVTATPGAHLLLETIERAGLPWAVVTGADHRLAAARLGAAGIRAPALIAFEDFAAGKPDPEPYRLAAARLSVAPERCLVVEDSEPGLAAGRAAGAMTASLRGLAADLRLADLAQLAHLLARARSREWWRDAVGYQVYLPSFRDSNGDGWGDLPGVTAQLDHLVELGVDIVWLTPFMVSPMRDHGYDVADYRRVDPSFGGDGALDRLLEEAHARGLRVIGDLVVNHTSDQHPWFAAARSGRSDPHRDYYLWRDPAPDGGPPNNWQSHFTGPAWRLDPATGQYYLHLFCPEQPDLNWRNPAVADEVDAVLEHWFARGLDGFRVDTAAYLVKHADLPDNPLLAPGQLLPLRGVTTEWRRQQHLYDIHQPDVHAIHERWRRAADRRGAFLVGEVYVLDPTALAAYVDGERLHSSFWFGLVEDDWDPGRFHDMLLAAAQASPRLSWVQGNHDRSRAASRYGGGELGRRRSLALFALMSLLPGTVWIYQGEELGLPDGVVPPGEGADPLARLEPGQSRDAARTPMPWRPGSGLGFTSGRPWLPDGDREPAHTAAVQRGDPSSHLSAIRRLLATRRQLFAAGAIGPEDPVVSPGAPVRRGPDPGPPAAGATRADGIARYRRGAAEVLVNLGDTPAASLALPVPAVFDSEDPRVTLASPRTGAIALAPQQALILRHQR
jgi:alpha-glucosidase